MTVLPWVVILVLTALNALYVAAEFAAVSVQKSQLAPIAKGGNRRAAGLLEILGEGKDLDRYIAACQIGITLTSLVAGAYGQATIARELGPILERGFSLTSTSAQSAAALTVLLALTGLQVVFGELVPKTLAMQYPERTALATYLPTIWSVWLYRWCGAIAFLNGSGFLLLKPFGVTPGGHQHVHSPQEIKLLFSEAHRGGALTPEVHQRLTRGLQLSNRTVRQLMVPRHEMYAIEASTPKDELVRRILESPYSRVPVYRGTLDNIVGVVSTKDVVGLFAARGQVPPLDQLIRRIPFVPEHLRADRFVRTLTEKRSSKAIVVDEFGGVQGIISMEDVLAELLGDVGDELKPAESGVELLSDGSMRLPGSMGLSEAENWLGTRWEGSAATLSGHIVAHLGRMPVEGEELELDGVHVTIAEMNPNAIRVILVRPPRESAPDAEEQNERSE